MYDVRNRDPYQDDEEKGHDEGHDPMPFRRYGTAEPELAAEVFHVIPRTLDCGACCICSLALAFEGRALRLDSGTLSRTKMRAIESQALPTCRRLTPAATLPLS